MSIVGTVTAPDSAPQTPRPSPPSSACGRRMPRNYGAYYGNRIVEGLRETGPTRIWELINNLACGEHPDDREQERRTRLEFLLGMKTLLKRKTIRRLGRKSICLPEDGPSPADSPLLNETMCDTRQGRLRRQYKGTGRQATGIGLFQSAQNQRKLINLAAMPSPPGKLKTESAMTEPNVATGDALGESENTPVPSGAGGDRDAVRKAARALAAMPRKGTRKWTGFLCGSRCWRGRLLLLPDGEIAPLLWANRGRVLLLNYRGMDFTEYLLWARRHEVEVRLYRCPEAALLGSLKFGVKERPSPSKAAAARRNGSLPPRPGARPRGRPPAGSLRR